MKNLSHILRYIGVLILLAGVLLVHYNIIDRGQMKVLLIVTTFFLLAGVIIFLIYGLKTVKAEKAGIKKLSNGIMFFALPLFVIGVMLAIFHIQRPVGKELMALSLFIYLLGFSVLIPAVIIALNKSKDIISLLYYRVSLIAHISIYLLVVFCLAGMLLRIFHYAASKTFLNVFWILLLVLFIVAMYLIKKTSIPDFKTIKLASDELDQYMGVYRNPQIQMDIAITKNDTKPMLMFHAAALLTFPLSAIGVNTFYFNRAGITVEFKPGKDFILLQGDKSFTFSKQ